MNPYNAVYFCNRAAAYSRLDKHMLAIQDCKAALKLDPNYSKAYGRLGIAYSSLERFEDARESYRKALELDPSNTSYKANLDRAEKQLADQTRLTEGLDFSDLMTSPNMLNIATQMINEPVFRRV